MKYFFILFVLIFIFPPGALAHSQGQPPMFLINGKYSGVYPIQANTTVFVLPEDIAPEHYLVNSPINFELDIEELAHSVSQEILDGTQFVWDFGDGMKGEGVKNTHTYRKPGSYILTILGSGEVVQRVLLHVFPDKKYTLPRAVVKVNGKDQAEDLLHNPARVNLRQYVQLDASGSVASSAKIRSFVWDFGNDKSSTEARVLYKYDDSVFYVMPVVRVTDENGFISDGYAHLLHDGRVVNAVSPGGFPKLSESQSDLFFVILYVVIGGVFAGGIIVMISMLLKKRKTKKI